MELYIYQFSSNDGSREVIVFSDYKLTSKEINNLTPNNTSLDQILTCEVLNGDITLLPLDRELKTHLI